MKPQRRKRRFARAAMACAVVAACVFASACADRNDETTPDQTTPDAIALSTATRSLTFHAVAWPSQYNVSPGISGHHLITWQEGGAAQKALFRANVSDRAVAEALRRLGAKPGENLTAETWEKRNDPDHPAPRLRAQGDALSITVRWDGSDGEIPIERLIEATPPDPIAIHFVGNERYIDHFGSGCITCLYSCPGGKTSNAAATIRQQIDETVRFAPHPTRLPPDAIPVEITFRLAK